MQNRFIFVAIFFYVSHDIVKQFSEDMNDSHLTHLQNSHRYNGLLFLSSRFHTISCCTYFGFCQLNTPLLTLPFKYASYVKVVEHELVIKSKIIPATIQRDELYANDCFGYSKSYILNVDLDENTLSQIAFQCYSIEAILACVWILIRFSQISFQLNTIYPTTLHSPCLMPE